MFDVVDFVNLDVRDAQMFSETLRFSVSALNSQNQTSNVAASQFEREITKVEDHTFVHNSLLSCHCDKPISYASNGIAYPSKPNLGYSNGAQWAL